MQHSVATLLFPQYRRSVLGLLLLHPDQALHGREIARRTGLPAGTITRELTKLADAGLLNRERRGNQQIYAANTASPIFGELASILRKTSGLADVLRDALEPLAASLQLAFVFGSVARGRETAGSDVDLMLVGDVTFRQAVEALHAAQATIARDINIQLFSPLEFADKAYGGDPFLADVLAKPKLFLIGSDDDLAQLAGHQP